MSSSVEQSPVNGHFSPDNDVTLPVIQAELQVDSDLSDADEPVEASGSISVSHNVNPFANLDGAGQISSDSDESDNDNASEDADFDMEDSVPSPQSDVAPEERSSSRESRRAPKRKAAVEEDEYIKANPELYGLRRSVWISKPFLSSLSPN
jgi:chromodomain-helicase-DNA-binding protein 1